MRKKIKPNNKKAESIELGISLYEMNKQLMAKEPLLTKEQLEEKTQEVTEMITNSPARAWMLLCNERQDFTIFLKSFHVVKSTLKKDFEETILNRGQIVSIDKQEDGTYEIWIKDNNQCFCYILFDYSNAIIDY